MFKKVTISIPEDLYLLIEQNRENTTRSYYIQNLCRKSLLELKIIDKEYGDY